MRWASYESPTDGLEHAALLVDDQLYAVEETLLHLLRDDETLEVHAERAISNPFEVVPYPRALLFAPVRQPPSVRDFMAFENHVVTSYAALNAEVSPVWYQQPVFYFTNPAAILGPQDPVPMAPGTEQYDFELEVAAVIGTAGSDLDPATADSHVAGYLIFCDWSARDLQATEMQVQLGPAKGKDTATTIGPLLVTPDELEPFRTERGYNLAMTVEVNGHRYSEGNWSDLYWSFSQMLAYASRGTTLRPGDVVGSGTVGTGCILELSRVHGTDKFPWLAQGDRVTVSVDQLGSFTSTIVDASATPRPLA